MHGLRHGDRKAGDPVIYVVIKSMDNTIAAFTDMDDADRYAESIVTTDSVEVRPVPFDDEVYA